MDARAAATRIQINLPGDRHLTLVPCGALLPAQIDEAVAITREVAARFNTFTLQIGMVAHFDKPDRTVAVRLAAPLNGLPTPTLYDLHDALDAALAARGLTTTQTLGFIPHVTLDQNLPPGGRWPERPAYEEHPIVEIEVRYGGRWKKARLG